LAIMQATRKHLRLAMNYVNWNREKTERTIDPYRLVFRKGCWYFVGYCHLRQDFRVFRLDHVRRVVVTQQTFVPDREIKAVEMVEHAIANTPWAWEFRVFLEMTLEQVRSCVSPALAEMEPVDGGVVLHGFTADISWAARFLVGLNCPFTVISPPEL